MVVTNGEIKVIQNIKFCQIAKFKCREICAHQNREVNVSRKFHVIRLVFSCNFLFFSNLEKNLTFINPFATVPHPAKKIIAIEDTT